MLSRWAIVLLVTGSLLFGGCGGPKVETPNAGAGKADSAKMEPTPVTGEKQLAGRETAENPESPQPPLKTEAQNKAEVLAEKAKETFFNESGAPRLAKAIGLADQALSLDAHCYQAHNIKGIALAFQGNLQAALQSINQAIAIKPDFAYAHFNRGLALAYHQKLDDSLAAYEKAAMLDPSDPWTIFGMASIHAQQQRPEKALEQLRKAIDIDPGCKTVAIQEKDKDFKNIRHLKAFQDLIR